MTLSDTIAASGMKPWCAGIESGDATGWPATDWIEDSVLRTAGARGLRQVDHPRDPVQLTRSQARVQTVADCDPQERQVRQRRLRRRQVHRHHRLPGGRHADHRPASAPCCSRRPSTPTSGRQGTKVAEDGDVFAFYFPAIDPAKGKPVLGGGEFVAAFADRARGPGGADLPGLRRVRQQPAKIGHWVSANKKLDQPTSTDPMDKLSGGFLQDRSDLPLRRLGPDAGRGRRGHVLEGHDRLDLTASIDKVTSDIDAASRADLDASTRSSWTSSRPGPRAGPRTRGRSMEFDSRRNSRSSSC